LSVIGEEGDVDLSKVDHKVLIDGFDENVFDHFEGKIAEKFRTATLDQLTVWVDPLDGTQVLIAEIHISFLLLTYLNILYHFLDHTIEFMTVFKSKE
jgi:hypothetical protein